MQDIFAYNEIAHELRSFFQEKLHYLEIPTHTKLSILSCKNPSTATTFQHGHTLYPLPQSSQIQLEKALLTNPQLKGVFSLGTSYRHDPHPLPGRHDKLFPLFEFVGRGQLQDLRKIYSELLNFLGLPTPHHVSYADRCQRYGKERLTPANEADIQRDLGNAVSLEYFTANADPFWTIKQQDYQSYNKLHLILHGMHTFSGAEHSCDAQAMRIRFKQFMKGEYAQQLMKQFGAERVEHELEDYLSLRLTPRFSGSTGLSRLARALNREEAYLEAAQTPYKQRQIA